MKTIKFGITALALILGIGNAQAFCGFYVAKADAKLFNKSSQVILVRDGNRSVITMSNDFQGDVKDFAMVVPVPEVLKQDNIRVADQLIFDKLDAYSGPRLVEYWDQSPCYQRQALKSAGWSLASKMETEAVDESSAADNEDLGVTIEASYTVGEYDILVLSATESSGLKTWLTRNGYKIPGTAHEVLDPYIKNDLKFFVVKVNLENQKALGHQNLRPIQIAFSSDKFMLPIRLGMANGNGDQDLVVYAFTKKGRVETTNYRTVKIPSNMNIPEVVQPEFGQFYVDMFNRSWEKESGKTVLLEYAWDLSSSNFVKCDPCATTPPVYADLREAGVFWASQGGNQNWGGSNYSGDIFFTRLHVRYNRKNYPQDLVFQETPNKEQFQGRYVMHHMYTGNMDCAQANTYYKRVLKRRQKEVEEMASLTGWNPGKFDSYIQEVASKVKPERNEWIGNDFNNKGFVGLLLMLVTLGTCFAGIIRKKR